MKSKTQTPRKIGTEVGSILVTAAGLFTLLSILSYHGTDPSFFASTAAKAQNLCGWVGAYLADFMLQSLGLSAFLIPAGFLFVAATLHQRESTGRTIATMAGMGLTALALSVFVSLQWKSWTYGGTTLLTGGAIGTWAAEALKGPFNPAGASIVSLSLFGLALVLSTPVSVARTLGELVTWLTQVAWRLSRILVKLAVLLGGTALMKSAQALSGALENRLKRRKDSTQQDLALEDAGTKGLPVIDSHATDFDESSEEETAPPPSETEALIDQAFEDEAPQESLIEISRLAQDSGAEIATSATASESPKPSKKTAAKTTSSHWKLPTLEFLRKPPKIDAQINEDRLHDNARKLQQKFLDFGIEGEVTAIRPGPVITLYEYRPGPGVKLSKIASMADDLSMALSANSVRIIAPLPGKSVVGIEIPNDNREKVFLRELLQHESFKDPRYALPIAMGKDIGGQPNFSDLYRMPHLLCAGQTGSGKSVFMNGLICSLLYRFTPDELRMILVDPKYVEFRAYQDIPHLLLPVVDDGKHAAVALKWAVREMERRYRILYMVGARNLVSYNEKVDQMGAEVINDILHSEENQSARLRMMSGSDWEQAFEADESGVPQVGKLPNVVIIIDELADLMAVAKKDVELSITRLAQKARAAGIHLVLATQRPSTDVVTGLIKSNLPSRVSFNLASHIDSRTILDRAGAEKLLGQGDMLFIPPGGNQLVRLHGAYVDDDEIHKITSFLKSQGAPSYREEILTDEDEDDVSESGENEDPLFQDGVALVRRAGHASASYLQRHLGIGYNRAAKMIEAMEARGIVGPSSGAKPRDVLIR